jgi:hypothetical protein
VLPVPLAVAVVPDALTVPIGVDVVVPITDKVEAPDTLTVTVPLLPVGVTDELALSDTVCEDETLVLALPVTVRLSRADALRVGVVELEGHPVKVPRPDELRL